MNAKYEAYKDSEHQWLGGVPEHWKVVNSRRIFRERKNRAALGEEQLTSSQKYGVIPQAKFMELECRQVTQVIKGHEILKHVTSGDFVISMRSFQGGLELSEYSGSISSAYVPIFPLKWVNTGYFKLLFKSAPFIQALQTTSDLVRDGQALRFENLSQISLPVPPLEEQEFIASKVSKETARIDALIEKKTRFIELLKEKRQALITQAVTKGLDPNVPMRDSGMPSVGDVPSHWDVVALRRSLRLKKNLVGKMWESFKLLSLTRRGVIYRDTSENHGKFPESFETYQSVTSGNLVCCLFDIDETPRTVGLSNISGMITGAYEGVLDFV